MALTAHDRFVWDATVTLEALGAADVALWSWEPERDRLRLTGAARRAGPVAPGARMLVRRGRWRWRCRRTAPLVEEILRGPARRASEITARVRMRGGEACIWRGVWLEDGVRAAGVVVPETKFAASERDALTGLLDRRSFVVRARERLQAAGGLQAGGGRPRPPAPAERGAGPRARRPGAGGAGLAPGRRLPAGRAAGPDRRGRVRGAGAGRRSSSRPRCCARRWSSRCASPASTSSRPSRSARCTAEGGDDAPEAAELLRRAELAVESAKSAGRGGGGRLRPGAGDRRPVAPGDGGRPARRHRARRDRALLPAGRAARHRRHLRLRGPGALAPSRAAACWRPTSSCRCATRWACWSSSAPT